VTHGLPAHGQRWGTLSWAKMQSYSQTMGKPLAGPTPHTRLKSGSLRNTQLIKPDLSHIFTTNLIQFVPQLQC